MAVGVGGKTQRSTVREIVAPFLEAHPGTTELAHAAARLRRDLRRDFYTIDDAKEAAEVLTKGSIARAMMEAVIAEATAPRVADSLISTKARVAEHRVALEKGARDSSVKQLFAIRAVLVDILEVLSK